MADKWSDQNGTRDMTDEHDFIAGKDSTGASGIPPPPTAMAVFSPGGGMNEFPVLKAFQQYLDAEQTRARKRMLGLCIFFIALLTVVVVTFVLVLMPILARNQSLQDRLLDMVLTKQNAAQALAPAAIPAAPVVNVQSGPAQAAPAADYESRISRIQQENLAALDQLRRTYEERDRKREEAERAERERKEKAQKADLERRLKESEARVAALEKAAAERAAKAKSGADKDAEREAFMRRNYPDYYNRKDRETGVQGAQTAQTAPRPAPSATANTELAPLNGMTDDEAIKRLIFADDDDDEAAPPPAPVAPSLSGSPRSDKSAPAEARTSVATASSPPSEASARRATPSQNAQNAQKQNAQKKDASRDGEDAVATHVRPATPVATPANRTPDSVMAPQRKPQTPAPAPVASVAEEEDDDPNYQPVNYYSLYGDEDDEPAPAAEPAPVAPSLSGSPRSDKPAPAATSPGGTKLPFVFLDDDED